MYGIMIRLLKTSTKPPCDSSLIATISRTPPEVQPPRPGNLVSITVAKTRTEVCQARPIASAVMKSPRYCARARKLTAVIRSAVRHSPRTVTRAAARRHSHQVNRARPAHHPAWTASWPGSAETGRRPTYRDSGVLSVDWNGRKAFARWNQPGKNHKGANAPESRVEANCTATTALSLTVDQKHIRSTMTCR